MTMATIGAAFCIFAANLWLIQYAGNLTPFWDEWDAGAAALLKPYVEGTFNLRALFHTANEHIIFFPRIVILAIYKTAGYYDVVLQMIFNALLLPITASVIVTYLSRPLDRPWKPYTLTLAVLINVIPFRWQNTLMGVGGTEFLLCCAFSIASLAFLVRAEAWSPKWLVGFALAIAAFLNAASGILACLAGAFVSVAQILIARRIGLREWSGVAILCVAALVFIQAFVPHVEAHDANQSAPPTKQESDNDQ